MKGVGLYYLTSRGSWGFLPSDFDRQTNTFSARVTSLEHFAVLQDSIPPQISAVRLTASANRNARFGIRDSFSGMFNENQIRVTVNGKQILAPSDLAAVFMKHFGLKLKVHGTKVDAASPTASSASYSALFPRTRAWLGTEGPVDLMVRPSRNEIVDPQGAYFGVYQRLAEENVVTYGDFMDKRKFVTRHILDLVPTLPEYGTILHTMGNA